MWGLVYLPSDELIGPPGGLTHVSCLYTWVEESIDVNDIFKESPFSIGTILSSLGSFKVIIDGLINLGLHLGSLLNTKGLSLGRENSNSG